MITLVNGYVCRDCSDEELAKRGVDPAHPKAETKADRARANEKRETDVWHGAEELGVNRPLEDGRVGAQLNLLA